MCDDDQFSFSLISTTGVETVYTPTEQGTDEFEFVDGENAVWEASSGGSTSLTPSVYSHEYEFGRRYHGFKSGRYPLPNDLGEQQREETKHALMLELTDGKLVLSDIGDYPQKIIDIGTGIGTWAIDVADLYPDASVIGTDLSPIQGKWLPVNVRMFVEDCEQDEWMHGSGFDLVHFRGVAGVLRDVDAVLERAYSHMRDGGWIEFQEFDHTILCDDNSMADDDPLRTFSEFCAQGMQAFGCAAFGQQDLRQSLERAGFQRVRLVTKKVPVSTWPRDQKQKAIGAFMRANIIEALGAFAAKPLAALGMSAEERKMLAVRVRKSLDDNRIHRYVNCCFYFGQKDESI